MMYFQIGLLIIAAYICVYGLVNRICTCIEHVALAKSFAKWNEIEAAKKEISKEA